MTEAEKQLLEWVIKNPCQSVDSDKEANGLVVKILSERVTPECREFVADIRKAQLEHRANHAAKMKEAKERWGAEQVEAALLGLP